MQKISERISRNISGQRLAVASLLITFLLGSGLAAAAGETAPANPAPTPAAGCVRGSDLMTPAEKEQNRMQMRGLSAEEHAKFMTAHHAAMRARAAEKGLTLCDEMPGGGMGKGPGGPGRGAAPSAP